MKRKYIGFMFILLLIFAFFMSLRFGSYPLSFEDIFQTLAGNGSKAQEFALYQIRLPRSILALMVGYALGVSGGILQSISKNQLAEPGMIGINAGAAFFVVLWISFSTSQYYSSMTISNTILMPLIAIAGSLCICSLIYFLSYKKGIQPIRFLLVGIGINAAINALITFFQLQMNKGDFYQVLTWTNGSLWGSSWQYILFTFPILFILVIITLYKAKTLDALSFQDEIAIGLGVRIQKERFVFLLIAASLAAVSTSVAGNIAFLGLLGPQIAKKTVGGFHRKMLFYAGISSAILLLMADILARNLFSPIEIPVGILVSILSIPYFLYLIFTSNN